MKMYTFNKALTSPNKCYLKSSKLACQVKGLPSPSHKLDVCWVSAAAEYQARLWALGRRKVYGEFWCLGKCQFMLPSLAEAGGSGQATAGLMGPEPRLPCCWSLLKEHKQGGSIRLLIPWPWLQPQKKNLTPAWSQTFSSYTSSLRELSGSSSVARKLSRLQPPVILSTWTPPLAMGLYHLHLGLSLPACFTKVDASRKNIGSRGRQS